MYNYIRYCSPLGMLTVTEEDGALIALVIDGQKYADRHLDGEGTERASQGKALAGRLFCRESTGPF